MEISRHLEFLRDEGTMLAATAQEADLGAPIAACPDWRLRDLIQHIGGVHRWAAGIVTRGMRQPFNDEENSSFFVKVSDGELVHWYSEAHSSLVVSLEDAEPALECWTFLPCSSPLAFWARRQAHETTVHRVDVQRVSPSVAPIAPELAVDGIDELLTGFIARGRGRLVSDSPVTLGVRTTDTDDRWSVRIEADRRIVGRGGSGGDCELSGPAELLYLFLWNREPMGPHSLEVLGDTALVDLWHEKARI